MTAPVALSKPLNRELFGARVRAGRERLGLTHRGLAEVTGVHYTLICHVERGQKFFSLESLVAVARALGESTDYLLGLSDRRPRRRAHG